MCIPLLLLLLLHALSYHSMQPDVGAMEVCMPQPCWSVDGPRCTWQHLQACACVPCCGAAAATHGTNLLEDMLPGAYRATAQQAPSTGREGIFNCSPVGLLCLNSCSCCPAATSANPGCYIQPWQQPVLVCALFIGIAGKARVCNAVPCAYAGCLWSAWERDGVWSLAQGDCECL